MIQSKFRAGSAQSNITPPLGTVINGEFTCRYANKIADPLFAKAIVLQDDTTAILIVVVDICAMKIDFLEQVKARIHREIGIPPQQQLISSTHTHSAGSVADLLLGHVDFAYREWLPGQIVAAAKEAFERLSPARIGWGQVEQPQHLLCRRYQMEDGFQAFNPVTGGLDQVKTNPFGAEAQIVDSTSKPDPELRYLAIQGLAGQWISLLANYSLHYVGDCERGTISADYFGYFAQSLRSLAGAEDDFVGIMSNGTSGEINIWDFQNPDRYPKGNHEKSKLIGEELARATIDSLVDVVWEDNPRLHVVYESLDIAVRKPSADELSEAKSMVSATDYENIRFGEPDFFRQVYAREQVLLSEYPEFVKFPVQSLHIVLGAIGALGGEFFSETGLKLKESYLDHRYFTICLANDYVGYVPPATELEKGGYECWRCRTSYLEENAEEKIRKALTKQLELHGKLV